MKKAFLFDLNGTVIDDMEFHAKAWYDILNNDLNANLTWEQVKKEMYGKNDELLVRIFGEGHFSNEKMKELSVEKERRYQKTYLPHLQLIKGLGSFFEKAHQLNIPMAIGSAAIPFNVNFVLDGLHIRKYFSTVVSADDVLISKPHPETFIKCAEQLQAKAEDCIVFEDSPKGVEAALKAGMKAVVIKTYHTIEEFAHLPNVILSVDDYIDPKLEMLFL
ncbi:MAG: HAD family phosphatase [Bacteroidota bacterium]|nr:HAD family phosphatase [Bacteroidota bacterium]